jgi:hypothetical protein
MKSSLRFVLLFALIVGGRLAKQPAPVASAKVIRQETPVHDTSFFARETTIEPVSAGGSGSRLWQATAPTTRTNVSLE